ncbi:MAG TPA: radical SAM protein [Vicinamibacterales bacterium]|nr:radical SAM protein [Vicinamibacterales bacterium]
MPLNACELEIDLLCRGLRVPTDMDLKGARSIQRTRAGLGSGLEIAIPAPAWLKRSIWVNVPVVERFVRESPYVLAGAPSLGYRVVDERVGQEYPIEIPREPHWYSRQTSRDVAMNRIAVMQGTYLAIYVNPVCAFWNFKPALNCKFCTTGRNVGESEEPDKALEDVLETCWAAKEESGITFAHLNGGYQGSRGIAFTEPYVRRIKEEVGLLVGVQLAPEKRFEQYDRLLDAGVDHLSFCIEFLDPKWFADICPGKDRMLGQPLFMQALEHCASKMPRGAVSGEIIAGLEPIESTLRAIEEITSRGAFPTVCIFRPTIGSDMEHWPPPRYEDMRVVMEAVYDACRRHRLPIGAAPNIEVSLVVNPDDTALLARRDSGFYRYELWRRAMKFAARPLFARKMRPAAGRRNTGRSRASVVENRDGRTTSAGSGAQNR